MRRTLDSPNGHLFPVLCYNATLLHNLQHYFLCIYYTHVDRRCPAVCILYTVRSAIFAQYQSMYRCKTSIFGTHRDRKKSAQTVEVLNLGKLQKWRHMTIPDWAGSALIINYGRMHKERIYGSFSELRPISILTLLYTRSAVVVYPSMAVVFGGRCFIRFVVVTGHFTSISIITFFGTESPNHHDYVTAL